MNFDLTGLMNYGAVGILLGVFLAVHLRQWQRMQEQASQDRKALFDLVTSQQVLIGSVTQALNENTEAIEALKTSLQLPRAGSRR